MNRIVLLVVCSFCFVGMPLFGQTAEEAHLISMLMQIADNKLPEQLYFLTGHKLEDNLDLQVELLRSGPLQLEGDFAETGLAADIKMTLPVLLKVRLDWEGDLIFAIRHHEDVDAELDIFLKVHLEFKDDELHSSSIVEYSWTRMPDIGKVTFEEADRKMKEILHEQTKSVNQRVNSILRETLY